MILLNLNWKPVGGVVYDEPNDDMYDSAHDDDTKMAASLKYRITTIMMKIFSRTLRVGSSLNTGSSRGTFTGRRPTGFGNSLGRDSNQSSPRTFRSDDDYDVEKL